MKTKRRFEEDDEGPWRAMLPRWNAPEAPPRLEGRLRSEFIARHRAARLQLWAGRAAILALAASAALLVSFGRAGRVADEGAMDVRREVAVAELDLTGFEPVARMRVGRSMAFSEAGLDGFEPLAKMAIRRINEGGR